MSKPLWEFEAFPKMPRLTKNMVITEKLDGTNAQVVIEDIGALDGRNGYNNPDTVLTFVAWQGREYAIRAGRRGGYLSNAQDAKGRYIDEHFGFTQWVVDHADELVHLGEGRHTGEWWGSGIERGYGLPKGEKRFSLFNVGRYLDGMKAVIGRADVLEKMIVAPRCCHVVPVLARHTFSLEKIDEVMEQLKREGSHAAPGFMRPEGVIVFYEGLLFKHTFDAPLGKWAEGKAA